MKPFMKFGAVLLAFGVILSMVVVMIIRTHAIPEAAVKTPTPSSLNSAASPASKN